MRKTVDEQSVAARAVAFLEGCGHDVYQEVSVGGCVVDIVALVGPREEVWSVEVKTTWSLDLLEQCIDRRRFSHRVFAAIPTGRSNHARAFRHFGIGVMRVNVGGVDGYGERSVQITDAATLVTHDCRYGKQVRALLSDGHKTHAKAGAPGAAGRWTEFRETCERLARVVQREPGITMKSAIDGFEHHYASDNGARSSLAHWVERGKVPGVRLERDGKALRLYPAVAA